MIKSVVCRVGSEDYAINVDFVLSIERMQKIRPLVQQADYVAGIMKLRGEILPIIDLRKWFGFESANSNEERIIVIKHNEQRLGLIVDTASDVIDIDENLLQEVEINKIQKGISQVFSKDKQLILILDVKNILKKMDLN